MVQRNFVMLSSRGCTEQKRKQPLSCNSTEGQMPLAKNGRIFDASIIHCRIDLSDVLIHCRIKHFCEEYGAADVKRFTCLSYDI